MDRAPVHLPEGCAFAFVSEGAANIVFDITLPQKATTAANRSLEGKLLRVAKANTQAFPHDVLQAYWEDEIRPLFRDAQPFDDCLVRQSLVRLGFRDVQRLNAVLDAVESRRRKHPSPVRFPVTYGMLVEDMRAREPGQVAFEFKPKWLAQSPQAPPSASRCRTCAHSAWKAVHRPPPHAHLYPHQGSRRAPRPPLCPLDLLEGRANDASLDIAADSLLASTAGIISDTQRAAFRVWLRTNHLVPLLREAQVRLNNERSYGARGVGAKNAAAAVAGIEGESPRDPAADTTLGEDGRETREARNLALAMTLRDCSCFVRISAAGQVEAKLADLDKKNLDAKAGTWREQERRLEREGYYFGLEKPRQATDCLLERRLALLLSRETGPGI